jgi:hypothetical protein
MPHDVAEMIDTVKAESHWPDEDTAILRHIVRALRHFRHERFYFSEKTGTFNAVTDQASYARDTDYPADLFEIDALRVEDGSGETPLDRVSYETYVDMNAGSTSTRGTPSVYAWHHDELFLWPTPGSAWVINVDYFFDATRDAASGDEITIDSSTAFTNDFFTRGEELLCARVLYSLSLGRAEDQKAALSAKAQYDEALRSLRSETHIRKVGSSLVVDPYFG